MKAAMGEEIDLRGCTLYPTWFRWKFNITGVPSLVYQDFISHMVQMKDNFVSSDSVYFFLFISHMVQMKEWQTTWGWAM